MGNPYTCDLCGVGCSKFSNLKRHFKNKHHEDISNPNFQSKINENEEEYSTHVVKNFKCGICDLQGTKQQLDMHYVETHGIDLHVEHIKFICINTFHEWKTAIEIENRCKFIAACGRKKNIERFICHRSGEFKSKSKGLRSLKKQGSKKIGSYCPSKIIVNKKGEICDVKFVRTHVGHGNELCHITLSVDIRAKIAHRLSQKVPPLVVLEEVKNSMSKKNDRLHLLTLKDLQNISKEFKINNKCDSEQFDETNIEKLINKLNCTDEGSSVLYYKPFGSTDESYSEFKADDFVLAIMNQSQRDMFQRFVKNTLIIDRTWKMTHSLHLFILLVLDENCRAFPCCFFFTNEDNECRLKFLFTILQSKFGSIKPNLLMSCFADRYYKAWTSVMDDPEYHVYCPWSVNQTWKNNLSKIKDSAKKNEVSRTLEMLCNEPDSTKFPSLLNEVVQRITGEEETRLFGQYFCKYYLQHVVKWARCYQLQLGLHDTTDLENICKIIKCIYFSFKKRSELNDCILFLYKYLRDKLFNKRDVYSEKEKFRHLQSLKKNHLISTSKSYSNAINEDGGWIVISSEDKTIQEVRNHNINCDCKIICDICNVCVHRYICSCTNSSIEWNMCDHIHYLCTSLKQNKKEDIIVVNDVVTFVNDSTIDLTNDEDMGKSYLSGDDGCCDNEDDIVFDKTPDDQSEINAVLEINELIDEIILNMHNQKSSSFVINNLRNILAVLKSGEINSLENVVMS